MKADNPIWILFNFTMCGYIGWWLRGKKEQQKQSEIMRHMIGILKAQNND